MEDRQVDHSEERDVSVSEVFVSVLDAISKDFPDGPLFTINDDLTQSEISVDGHVVLTVPYKPFVGKKVDSVVKSFLSKFKRALSAHIKEKEKETQRQKALLNSQSISDLEYLRSKDQDDDGMKRTYVRSDALEVVDILQSWLINSLIRDNCPTEICHWRIFFRESHGVLQIFLNETAIWTCTKISEYDDMSSEDRINDIFDQAQRKMASIYFAMDCVMETGEIIDQMETDEDTIFLSKPYIPTVFQEDIPEDMDISTLTHGLPKFH